MTLCFAADIHTMFNVQFKIYCSPSSTSWYRPKRVMPCGGGVKAGMVCVWVAGKTVWSPCYTWAISEHFRGVAWQSAIQIHVYCTLLYCNRHMMKCEDSWTYVELNRTSSSTCCGSVVICSLSVNDDRSAGIRNRPTWTSVSLRPPWVIRAYPSLHSTRMTNCLIIIF